MKKLNIIKKLEPINKKEFTREMLVFNEKRTLPAMILLFVLITIMQFSHRNIIRNETDILLVERSESLLVFASVWSFLLLIGFILYILSKTLLKQEILKKIITFYVCAMCITWGYSMSLTIYFLDGETFFTFFTLYTLFVSLFFLLKPLGSFIIFFGLAIIFTMGCLLIPGRVGFPSMPTYDFEVFVEAIAAACFVGFVISRMSYRHFLDTFNKNYEIKKLNEELIYLNQFDALTNLYNREQFLECAEEKIKSLSLRDKSIHIAMIDIDFFKQYNDTYGHLEGNRCLKAVAAEIKKTVEGIEDGLVARFGGEEFMVMIVGVDEATADNLFMNIIQSIENLRIEHKTSSISDYLTVSIGVHADIIQSNIDLFDMLNIADMNLYRAKSNGRNQIAKG